METHKLTRREFLKTIALAAMGLYLPSNLSNLYALPYRTGRVIPESIDAYDQPSVSGIKTRLYWKDSILPIIGVVLGKDKDAYNRIWYQVNENEYVYSGYIQPVNTVINQVEMEIPRGGMLAEVTVPYTDARWEADPAASVAYRFYYQTTHWVVGVSIGVDNEYWYRILDDKWELTYFVPAKHLRIIPKEELTPLSPEVPTREKYIEVRTREQLVIAYEYNKIVFVAKTATGARFSDGNFSTPPGTHYVFHKRPFRHMAAGNLAYNGYDLPGVPWVSYFTERGVAFHGTFWHNDYGRPRSHGCVNLTPAASKWIYRWTTPVVPANAQYAYKKYGTRVEVI